MNLEQLRALLEKCVRDQEAILNGLTGDAGEAREMNDVEKETYAGLEKRSEELQRMIERAEKVMAAKAKVKDLGSPAGTSPSIEVIREANFNERGEYKGFKSLGEQLICIARAAMRPHTPDQRLIECHRAATGANETIDSEGGFALQPDFAISLFSGVVDAGTLAPLCTKVPTTKNSILLTLLDETSMAIGSQFGGVQAYWRAEAGTVTASKPKYRQERMEAEALEALYYATDELLEDAPALQVLVEQAFTQTMAFQLDDAILRGDGAGKPLGILNSGALISVAKETSQTADTVVFENVNKMVDQMHPIGDNRAIWLHHRTVGQQLRQMVLAGSSSDVPVWLPAGAYGNPEQTLFGRPLKKSQHCSAVGDLGDLLYLDLLYYLLLVKTGIKASESSHVAFLTGQKVFKWTQRCNGMPAVNSAITDAHGSGTTSPFVAIAARA